MDYDPMNLDEAVGPQVKISDVSLLADVYLPLCTATTNPKM
jgi:hypothetical protein